MRLWHSAAATSVQFDESNLVSCAGLVPVMRLAQDCGLAELVAEHLRVAGPLGANTPLKVGGVVAGMLAGADSIDDLDVLRHGGMGELFDGVRAPSTLGSFLRAFSWGSAGQLEAVNRRLLAELAVRTPVLADADKLAFLDVDSCQRRVYGHAKQGVGFGHAKVGGYQVRLRGLNPLIAAISTPTTAPAVTGTRLRGGTANSARGAGSFVAAQIGAARAAGAVGELIVRMDSGFYTAAAIAACRRGGARFSVTARMDRKIRRAIAAIPDHAWTGIRYPQAIFDEQEQRWILRRRGRRNQLHRVRLPPPPGGDRPTDRAPGPPARPARADRARPGLALPRGVHRQPVPDADRRVRPPRPRDHRAGTRRTHRRAARAPTLRELRRQRRLAVLRGDLPQPAARGRHSRLAPPRPRSHRDPAPPPRRRPRPDRPPRPRPDRAAPPGALALARPLGRAVRRHPPRPPGTPDPRRLTGPGTDPAHPGRPSRSTSRSLRTESDTPQNRQRPIPHTHTQPKRSPFKKTITQDSSVDQGSSPRGRA